MKSLPLAEGLALPADEAGTQKYAFTGRSGAGKTYGVLRLAELLLGAQVQVVILDRVGVHYGLRLAADGRGAGLPIHVFGGEHGDLPLDPASGALVANVIVEKGISAVLDVSRFRKGPMKDFVTAFAEELFHRKKTQRSQLHFIVEEAQAFVPQVIRKGEERMFGAMEDLIKLGRNYGIGITLVTQRPQAVSKDVLNMTEVLVVFQMTGPQERKTIEGWIVEKGLDSAEAARQLPSLKVGDAMIWSPQWLGKFVRTRITTRTTYDASSTPRAGAAKRTPGRLAPLEMDAVRNAMTEATKRAEENDPRILKAQVAKLERELARELKRATMDAARQAAKGDRTIRTDQATRKELARIGREIEMDVRSFVTELEQERERVAKFWGQVSDRLTKAQPPAQALRELLAEATKVARDFAVNADQAPAETRLTRAPTPAQAPEPRPGKADEGEPLRGQDLKLGARLMGRDPADGLPGGHDQARAVDH